MAAKGRKSQLKRGWRLFRRRKYGEVISLLEPQVFMYRENPEYFELLGLSCLYTGDFAGAHSYLSRAEHMESDRVVVLNGLAAVAFRRRQTDEALRLWLKVLDHDPKNKIARRGLAYLRDNEDATEIVDLFEEGKAKRYLPKEPFALPLWFYIALLVIALGALAYVVTPVAQRWIAESRGEERPGVELVALPPEGERLATEGDFRTILTEEELTTTLRRAREYFNEYRDNMAQREINRLLASNAAQPLKERARLLESYLREPDFTSFNDNFNYAEVAADPWLYRGTYVRWKGTVSNLDFGEDRISFDFLVGYQERRVLEGVVPAYLEFAALLEGGMAVEVIAEVELGEKDRGFRIRISSIRRLEPSD